MGKKLSDLTEKITEVLATIESQLDFSDEEDVSDLSVDKSKEMIGSLSASVESLLKNYQPYSAESKKKTVVLFGELTKQNNSFLFRFSAIWLIVFQQTFYGST